MATSAPQIHQVLNRLSGGNSELYRTLCEVAFTTALGPGALRRLADLQLAPNDVAKLVGASPTETVTAINALCDKANPASEATKSRVTVRKEKTP